jgi:hypothetical protein
VCRRVSLAQNRPPCVAALSARGLRVPGGSVCVLRALSAARDCHTCARSPSLTAVSHRSMHTDPPVSHRADFLVGDGVTLLVPGGQAERKAVAGAAPAGGVAGAGPAGVAWSCTPAACGQCVSMPYPYQCSDNTMPLRRRACQCHFGLCVYRRPYIQTAVQTRTDVCTDGRTDVCTAYSVQTSVQTAVQTRTDSRTDCRTDAYRRLYRPGRRRTADAGSTLARRSLSRAGRAGLSAARAEPVSPPRGPSRSLRRAGRAGLSAARAEPEPQAWQVTGCAQRGRGRHMRRTRALDSRRGSSVAHVGSRDIYRGVLLGVL